MVEMLSYFVTGKWAIRFQDWLPDNIVRDIGLELEIIRLVLHQGRIPWVRGVDERHTLRGQ